MISHKPQHFYRETARGAFTLMESIIAIAILMIAITSSMSLVSDSIATARLSKNRLIAAGLAQETLELLRNRRDENFLAAIHGESRQFDNSDAWLDGINNRSDNGTGAHNNPCWTSSGPTKCIVRVRTHTGGEQNFSVITKDGCASGKCETILLDQNEMIYRHLLHSGDNLGDVSEGAGDSGVTQFRRYFEVYEPDHAKDGKDSGPLDNVFMRATVYVEWDERGGTQQVSAQTYLYNWLPL